MISEKLKQNEVTKAKLLNSGSFGGFSNSSDSIFKRLQKREINGSLSMGELSDIGSCFIPNDTNVKKTIMDEYTGRAYSGQYSHDGSLYFSCSQDFIVRVYDTERSGNYKLKRAIAAQEGRWTITDAVMTKDNRFIVYSSITPSIYLVSLAKEGDCTETLNLTSSPEFDAFGIWSLRFSGDSREIVAGTSSHCIYVYDIEAKTIKHTLRAHKDDVNAVAFAEDDFNSNIVLSGSDDSMIYIWDRRSFSSSHKPEGECAGHTEGLTYLSPKGDGRYILSNGKDQKMKLWDMRKMVNYKSTPTQPRRYRWDYRRGYYPGIVETDNHPHDSSVLTMYGHKVLSTLIRCYFSPSYSTGQRYCISGSQDGYVYIYSLDGKLAATIDVADSVVRDVVWHPQWKQLMATCWDGNIYNLSF